MKSMIKLLAIILVSACASGAQNVSLSGRLLDQEGKPLVGVQIELKAAGLRTLTTGDGRFSLTKIATALAARPGIDFRHGRIRLEGSNINRHYRIALTDPEGRERERSEVSGEEILVGADLRRYFPQVRRPGLYLVTVASTDSRDALLAFFDGRIWMGKGIRSSSRDVGTLKKMTASPDTLLLYLAGYKMRRIAVGNLSQNLGDLTLERDFFEGRLSFQFGQSSGFTGGDAPRIAQDGLVGWGSSRVVSFLNDSKGAQEASLHLEWGIRAPKSAIFELGISEWVYVLGSATVNGSGWFGTGIDSRIKLTVDLVVEAGNRPTFVYHATVHEDATKSENRRKKIDGSFQTPGKIHIEAREGEWVRMYLLLNLTSSANSEGSCSATIDAFGPAATWDNPDFVTYIRG